MVPSKTVFVAPPAAAQGPDSRIYVIFTDAAGARTALEKAAAHARGLDLQIEVLAAQVVPFPLPLHEPPVLVEFTEQAMSQLVAGIDAAVSVQILLCRDADEALRNAVGRDSLVVIAGGKRKLARLLAADGHRLILIH